MSTSPEARMIQLTMTDDEFSVLNAMCAVVASSNKTYAKMAHILILAMPDATVNLFKKVNALAKASLPEKLEKLATMKRGGYAE